MVPEKRVEKTLCHTKLVLNDYLFPNPDQKKPFNP